MVFATSTNKQRWRALLLSHWPSFLRLDPNLLNVVRRQKWHLPGLFHTKTQAFNNNTSYTIHGLLQDASLFISTDAFSFSRSLSCYIFLFSFPRRKMKYQYWKVGRLPLLFHLILYYDTIPHAAPVLFRRLIFGSFLWVLTPYITTSFPSLSTQYYLHLPGFFSPNISYIIHFQLLFPFTHCVLPFFLVVLAALLLSFYPPPLCGTRAEKHGSLSRASGWKRASGLVKFSGSGSCVFVEGEKDFVVGFGQHTIFPLLLSCVRLHITVISEGCSQIEMFFKVLTNKESTFLQWRRRLEASATVRFISRLQNGLFRHGLPLQERGWKWPKFILQQ